MKKEPILILGALLCMVMVSGLAYVLVGGFPGFLFSLGFFTGFILWFMMPTDAQFRVIKIPFYLTFILYVLNKLEESLLDFFPALSNMMEAPVSKTGSIELYFIQTVVWLFIPFLIKRSNQLGYYLLWSFYISMGIVELIHFLIPLFSDNQLTYSPGMASVLLLIPASWWGMYRLL